jgi:hypothetical protein
MTKKDYIKIAKVLKKYILTMPDDTGIELLIQDFSNMLAEDNINFSPLKFKNFINDTKIEY